MRKTVLLALLGSAVTVVAGWTAVDALSQSRHDKVRRQIDASSKRRGASSPQGHEPLKEGTDSASAQGSTRAAHLTSNDVAQLRSAMLKTMKDAVDKEALEADRAATELRGVQEGHAADEPLAESPDDGENAEGIDDVAVVGGEPESLEDLEAEFQKGDDDPIATQDIEASMLAVMEDLNIPQDLLTSLRCHATGCRVQFDISDEGRARSLSLLSDTRFGNDSRVSIWHNEDGRPETVIAFFARDGLDVEGETSQ